MEFKLGQIVTVELRIKEIIMSADGTFLKLSEPTPRYWNVIEIKAQNVTPIVAKDPLYAADYPHE